MDRIVKSEADRLLPLYEQPIYAEQLPQPDPNQYFLSFDEFVRTPTWDRLSRTHHSMQFCDTVRKIALEEAGRRLTSTDRRDGHTITVEKAQMVAYATYRRTGVKIHHGNMKIMLQHVRCQLRRHVLKHMKKYPNDLRAVENQLLEWSHYPYLRWMRSNPRQIAWEKELREKALRGDYLDDKDGEDSDCMIVDEPEDDPSIPSTPTATAQSPSTSSAVHMHMPPMNNTDTPTFHPTPIHANYGRVKPHMHNSMDMHTPAMASMNPFEVQNPMTMPSMSPAHKYEDPIDVQASVSSSTTARQSLNHEFQYLVPEFNRIVARCPEKQRAIKNLLFRLVEIADDVSADEIRLITESLPIS